MPRHANPLSARLVQAITKRGFYCDGGGLYLQVSPTGSKSWVFRYTLNGRKRDMGLGSLTTFTLSEARERARKMRQLVAEDIDPLAQRAAKRAAAATALTFRQCAERYVTAHESTWRGGAKPWTTSLEKHVFPTLGDAPVGAIELSHILQVIERLWAAKPVTAARVRGRIESILAWATVRGLRQGENPARWRGHLDQLLPSKEKMTPPEHRAALPYTEVGDFMLELRKLTDHSARALELAILTATRSGEATGAGWAEIDLAQRLWTIPAARMKAGKEHRVPLSAAAIALLERQLAVRENEFVFPGAKLGRPVSLAAPMVVIKRLGRKGQVTGHGFRSSFRDWTAERTNFPREVAEVSLAHITGNAVERAYQRGDFMLKRRQLMEAWARYCETPASKVTGEVVALARP
jgi:integrase